MNGDQLANLKPGDRVEIEGFSAVGQPAVTGDPAVTLSEGTRTLTLTVDGELTAAGHRPAQDAAQDPGGRHDHLARR